jgi:hypothetical protein
MAMLASIGLALAVVADTERTIAAASRTRSEIAYAAEAGAERALEDVEVDGADRWTDFLSGVAKSTFTDTSLTPLTNWGARLDLTALTVNRQTTSDAAAGPRANRPQWRLFAYGPLSALLDGIGAEVPAYLVVWIADDPSEMDNDPSSDANGEVMLVAEALGPGGANQAIEVAVARAAGDGDSEGTTGQRGGGETNTRASAMPVGVPGQPMTAMKLDMDAGRMVAQ